MENIDRSFETGDSNKVDIYIYTYVCVKLKYICMYLGNKVQMIPK